MNKEELFTEINLLNTNIDKMMVADNVEEFGEAYNLATKNLSTIFLENLRRIVNEEEAKLQILEESLEVEDEYDVDVSECIRNCSNCKNNVEFPPPHTCDICTSLDQEEDYEMWEPKDDIHWYSEMLKKPEEYKRVIVRDEDGNEYRNHAWTGHTWYIFDDCAGCPTHVDVISWRYQ